MPDVTEINAVTGEVIERDYTEEELKQRDADAKARKVIADEQAKVFAAKESAKAKLTALGLTEDEVNGLIS